MTPRDALLRACEIAGGQTALARVIGGKVRQGHIWYWLNTDGAALPAEYCITVENATRGEVSRYDLRPDVFGPHPETAGASR